MAQYWPNLGSQQSAIVIGPVSPFASVKCWADDGGLCWLFEFTDLQPKLGPVLTLYQAHCHFYNGKPFWKWENQSSTRHRPAAVPKTSVGGQSLGQNWPPSAYRNYHSSNGTTLATDLWQHFCRCWAGPGPYLTLHLDNYVMMDVYQYWPNTGKLE